MGSGRPLKLHGLGGRAGAVQAAEEGRGDGASASRTVFQLHFERALAPQEVSVAENYKPKFQDTDSPTGLTSYLWQADPVEPSFACPGSLEEHDLSAALAARWRSVCETEEWRAAGPAPGEAAGRKRAKPSRPALETSDFRSPHQQAVFGVLRSYRDVLHTARELPLEQDSDPDLDSAEANRGSGERGRSGGAEGGASLPRDDAMDAYLLHILQHVLATQKAVRKGNERASKSKDCEPPRDQIQRLVTLVPNAQRKDGVSKLERVQKEYGPGSDSDDEDLLKPKKAKNIKKTPDFRALFQGNQDDHFRLGVKITRASVRLFTDFYGSDIIVASPLGLVTRLEAGTGNPEEADFLSSVEVVVVDHADVMMMQNWAHVVRVFENLNRVPTDAHGQDMMRVKEWYLDGHAKYYRQNFLLTSFPSAEVNGIFHKFCKSHAGKARLHAEPRGVLSMVGPQVQQTYERLEVKASAASVDDARFTFFVQSMWPRIRESATTQGILIFVRSYFDYVRLRNFLNKEEASVCLNHEYADQKESNRARSMFYTGAKRIMLYTERAHFYRRQKIRGIRDVYFYSLPDRERFYVEILNMLEETESRGTGTCTVMFHRFDRLQLARVVGATRCTKMLASENNTYMFC